MRGWRAYYASGERIDSSESSWANLPANDLVGVVVFKDPPYRHMIDGYDWVWMEDGEIHLTETHSEWGKWSDPPQLDCNSCLKKGVGMDDEDFASLQSEMFEDRRWP